MKILLYMMIAITLGACRSTKEKQGRQHQENKFTKTTVSNRSLQLLRQDDSTHRSWHYTSGDPFYFHPDSGLYATSGKLQATEYQLYSRSFYEENDSTFSNEQREEVFRNEQRQRWTRQYRAVWLVGMVVLLLLLIAAVVFSRRKKLL